MARILISVTGYRCERCSHQWVPRAETEPRVCPKCKSPYWDKPKRIGRGGRKPDDAIQPARQRA